MQAPLCQFPALGLGPGMYLSLPHPPPPLSAQYLSIPLQLSFSSHLSLLADAILASHRIIPSFMLQARKNLLLLLI